MMPKSAAMKPEMIKAVIRMRFDIDASGNHGALVLTDSPTVVTNLGVLKYIIEDDDQHRHNGQLDGEGVERNEHGRGVDQVGGQK